MLATMSLPEEMSPTLQQRYRTLSFDVPKCSKDNRVYQRNDRRRRSSSGTDEVVDLDLQRDFCMTWIHDLSNHFGFPSRTFFLTASFLDTTLSRVKIKSMHVRCCAVACFMVACKVNEEPEEQPTIKELIVATGASFSRNDLVRMEKVVLKHLNYSLTPVTPDTLLISLYECCTEQAVTEEYEVPEPVKWAVKVMERCVCRSPFLRFNPTTLALASLLHVVRRRGICCLLKDLTMDDTSSSRGSSTASSTSNSVSHSAACSDTEDDGGTDVEDEDEDWDAAGAASKFGSQNSLNVSYDKIKTGEQVFERLESLFETYAKHIDRNTVNNCIDELIALEMELDDF